VLFQNCVQRRTADPVGIDVEIFVRNFVIFVRIVVGIFRRILRGDRGGGCGGRGSGSGSGSGSVETVIFVIANSKLLMDALVIFAVKIIVVVVVIVVIVVIVFIVIIVIIIIFCFTVVIIMLTC
jgi:hypothetical protein